MAQVLETNEPTVVHEHESVHHVHDEPRSSNTGLVIALIVLIIVLVILFWWRPWTGGSTSSPTINVHTPTPNVNVSH